VALDHPLFWILFNVFVVIMLALDLGVLNRRPHEIRFREALSWSLVWVALAAAFATFVFFWHGRPAALEFVGGYLVEQSLSIDNLFVFLVIFRYFKVPAPLQHRVLYWGIIGALVMRGVFIIAGVGLIRRFDWLIYLFGAFLVFNGVQLMRQKEMEVHPDQNPIVRLLRRFMPVSSEYDGGKFLVRRERLYATPMLVVLLVIETTDVLFAVDSVPAVLAISLDPFIVYTSNVFAILGLRSMYFVLAGMMQTFRYLHYGLSVILIFIGVKMLISHYYKIPTGVALAVVAALLALSVAASLLHRQAPTAED
jgi:tellurite resistance protein TerC